MRPSRCSGSRGPGGPNNFFSEFWPFWPPRAPGPTTTPRAHRGEPIPPIPVEIRCNRTEIWPKNGLAHVCSNLPRLFISWRKRPCRQPSPPGEGKQKLQKIVFFGLPRPRARAQYNCQGPSSEILVNSPAEFSNPARPPQDRSA